MKFSQRWLSLKPFLISFPQTDFTFSFLHPICPLPKVYYSVDELHYLFVSCDFPGGSDGKASAYNVGDPGSIPGSGRSPGEGKGNPLQYSCLENPMDRGAWQAWSWMQLGNWTLLDCKLLEEDRSLFCLSLDPKYLASNEWMNYVCIFYSTIYYLCFFYFTVKYMVFIIAILLIKNSEIQDVI